MKRARRAICWFRRDLRVVDNRTLETATRSAERVWPVFIVDPSELRRHQAARGRVAWFAASAAALDAELRRRGSGLTVRIGPPERVLGELMREIDGETVVAGADEDPKAAERDRRISGAVDLQLVDDQRIVPPDQVRTAAGTAYAVYSPFRRALTELIEADPNITSPALPVLDRLALPLRSDAFDAAPAPHALPEPGEGPAEERLHAFVHGGLGSYADDRDRPDRDGTSRLSAYLRVGALSVRACWRAAIDTATEAAERGDEALMASSRAWRGELVWREFFAHVMAANPRLATESVRRAYDAIEWLDGPEADAALHAWREGRTGFPMVDAGMRELVATGWMHNRARLVTASFLVKDAGVDWRRGESVFLEHLLDADTQQNNGNWQWVAGVGTDAAPYYRIFNPTVQGRRFDPTGSYVRRWVPELAALPDDLVHEPWRAPRSPADYPAPILDHAEARRRTLARYRAATADAGELG